MGRWQVIVHQHGRYVNRHRSNAVIYESFRRDVYCGRISEDEYQQNRQRNSQQRYNDRSTHVGGSTMEQDEQQNSRDTGGYRERSWNNNNRYAQYERQQRRFRSYQMDRPDENNTDYTPNDDYWYSYETLTRERSQNRQLRNTNRGNQDRRDNSTRPYITNELTEINDNDL